MVNRSQLIEGHLIHPLIAGGLSRVSNILQPSHTWITYLIFADRLFQKPPPGNKTHFKVMQDNRMAFRAFSAIHPRLLSLLWQ